MKKIYFLIYVLCITLISSCNNDSLDGTQNDPERYREMQIRSGGDGAYDLLGYGYDITGEYGPTSGKSQVIDLNAFLNTYPDRIETNEPRSSTYEITTGYNSLDLSQKMAINFSSSSTIAFSDEIKLSLASEYSSNSLRRLTPPWPWPMPRASLVRRWAWARARAELISSSCL